VKGWKSLPARCILLAAIIVLFSVPAAWAADELVIKMATLAPQGSEWHQVLLEMGASWQKASHGQVSLRLYPGGVAGDDTDVVRKMRLGTLNGGFLAIQGISEIDRSVLALEVPLAYADYDEFDCVLEKMGPQLEKLYEEKGFVILGWTDAGWAHFFTKSPVRPRTI
jgi:TRAP-type transport system periplasmic protein